jgi:DUF1680 family protein
MKHGPLLAAVLTVAVAVAHSVLGERYLLVRLFRRTELPRLFGSDWLTRRTLRFAWHLTSIAWLGLAALLALLPSFGGPGAAAAGRVIALTFLVTGLVTALASRGRHLAWVVFLAIAALAWVGCAREPALREATRSPAEQAGWVVEPFGLDEVRLGDGLFQRKRDLMLAYARGYGGDADPYAGPDRLLSIFRANAGLDTRGAEPVGGWESATGYLRGHYAGHFMSLLAQAWASTGDEIYQRKLDYLVEGLAECQAALAEAARRPTSRVPGVEGGALRLTGSPVGHAEHVRLPGDLGLAGDFTVATWIRLAVDDASSLPDQRLGPLELVDGAAVFDFGSPSPDYAEPPEAHMALTLRVSQGRVVPRFAITASGEQGEQSLEGARPLPIDEWVHLAVTKSGSTGTLWVGGEPAASAPSMTLSPADLGELRDNWVGRLQFPQRTVSYLNATLDELVVAGRALTGEEIARLAGSPGAGAGEAVAAWYRFDEANGPTLVDSSGNGRDAEVIAPGDGRRHPGFLSAYPETQFIRLEELATYGGSRGIWAPYYTLHKIMAGLIDAYRLAGNDTALEVVAGIGDWVAARMTPLGDERLDRMWDIYIAGEYGGINESLATLDALLPGHPEYLEAARRFVNRNVYGPVAAGEDVLDGRHANQHIPQFTGYLRAYERSRDAAFLAAARNFWDMVVPRRIYSHGGVGVGEMLRGPASAASLFEDENHAETCPLYNLLKLSRNLFFHDPQAKYMDYYELGLFNQMAGSRRDMESAESPQVTYFVPVRPGRARRYGNLGTCCGGTGMESHTKYQDSIYFRGLDGSLWVNLYIPSTLRWADAGFVVTQQTRFPEEGSSTLVIDGSGRLAIRLRVPWWAGRGYSVTIDGEPQSLDAVPGSYVSVEREWSPGDRIDISMPLGVRTESVVDDPSVQSLHYGPLVLALQAEPVGEDLESGLIELGLYRHLKLDGDLAAALGPGEGPLRFIVDGLEATPLLEADAAPASAPLVAPEDEDEEPAPATRPYHLYFRRHEPAIVFGSVDSGVANPVGAEGLTFLDVLWSAAPFADHRSFVSAVERLVGEWQGAGRLTAQEGRAVVEAAAQAEQELQG